MNPPILVIDDDRIFSLMISKKFKEAQLHTEEVTNAKDAREKISLNPPQLIILDVHLPDESGIDFVHELKKLVPQAPILMVSSSADTPLVVNAIQNGASDYIKKPVNFHELLEKAQKLIELQKIRQNEYKLDHSQNNLLMIGKSPQTRHLIRQISQVALSDATVLLRGESGTGKSLVAEVIHQLSTRKNKNFVDINCAAIPSTLLESELFGHEKGSFTGAIREKPGKFEIADKGTLFLDEIGDLPPELQVKLLRFLQGHEFERVGGLKTIKADVRVISATNRNLENAIYDGKFREDLFYRLNVLPIYIPPLRERKEDIPLLVNHFLKVYSEKAHKHFEPLSENILNYLSEYAWPGNIRELQNIIERSVVLAKDPILHMSDFAGLPLTPKHSLEEIPKQEKRPEAKILENFQVIKSVQDIEKDSLINALKNNRGNVSKAAESMGLSRGTLYRRMKKYEIGLKNES